jgi:hypothetical protein
MTQKVRARPTIRHKTERELLVDILGKLTEMVTLLEARSGHKQRPADRCQECELRNYWANDRR